jgi:uncharacterized protein YjbI with pentapeptide repeats
MAVFVGGDCHNVRSTCRFGTLGVRSVNGHLGESGRRPQFTIRAVLVAIAFLALVLGWYSAVQRAEVTIRRLSMRAMHAEAELRARKLNDRFQDREAQRNKRVLSRANLEGVNLRNTSIAVGASAFQRACFNHSDLESASLTGGASSFQYAQFDNANLVNATLTGGGASFSLASFDNANLSGAVLTGQFQGASFAGAKLIGTQFRGSELSFQAVNIDGAQFEGADLSAIRRYDLESCFFQTPPTYDEKTRFPEGFDPVVQLWTRHKLPSDGLSLDGLSL